MTDRDAMRTALAEARAARQAAEDACCDVEELLWEVERGPRAWRRLAQVDPPEPVDLSVAADELPAPSPMPLAA